MDYLCYGSSESALARDRPPKRREGQFILIGSSPSLLPRSCLPASLRFPSSIERASRLLLSQYLTPSLDCAAFALTQLFHLYTTCVGRLAATATQSLINERGAFHSRPLKFLDEEADDSGDGFSASILASWYSKMVLRWTYEG